VSDSTASALSGFALLDAGELSLKGKSNAQRLHLLVGDDVLGQSEAFKEIAVLHTQLRKDIAAGRQHTASNLAAELEHKARAILPELAAFYAKVGSRKARATTDAA
jgi:adenylate cyclase